MKKARVLLFLLCLAALAIVSTAVVNATDNEDAHHSDVIIGDIDCDGKVNSLDAATVLRYNALLPTDSNVGTIQSIKCMTDTFVDENLHLWIEVFGSTEIDLGYVGTTAPTDNLPLINLDQYAVDVLIGDMNEDGAVDSLDAAFILKYDAKLPTAECVGTIIPSADVEKNYVDDDLHYQIELSDGTKMDAGYVGIQQFTVTFKDYDGTVLKSETVDAGSSVSAPADPEREGYRFTGWDGTADNVSADLVINAQYIQQFTVTFKDYDGTVLKSETVDAGSSVSAPADPERQGYRFICWDGTADDVSADLVINAQYIQQFTVTFKDYDGTVLKSETVDTGSSVSAPADPEREGYRFTGWDGTADDVSADLVINAQYIQQFTVTFKDYDGTVLKSETVDAGSSVSAPADPEREGYRFTGWDGTADDVSADLVINAQYIQQFTVTFKDYDGTVLKSETVDAGSSVSAPADPEREGYRFTGWDGTADDVSADLVINAQYIQQFTVTFKDYDGTVLKSETVDTGSSVSAPANPSRAYYSFTGWDKEFTNITNNLIVTAQYTEIKHNVNYQDTKGVQIPEAYTSYSEHAGIQLPTAEVMKAEGYEFKGWYTLREGGDRIDHIEIGSAKDITVYARWTAIEYTITYNQSAVHSNPKTYTIEDEIVLEDPTWSGLVFAEWIDHSGKVVFYENAIGQKCAKIPQGTTGSIEISAMWSSYRNLVVPSTNDTIAPVYDAKTGRYFFIYELGTIKNVVLDKEGDSYTKTTDSEHTLTVSKNQTIEESTAQSLAQTIGNSVTIDEYWDDNTEWVTHWDAQEYIDVSINLGGGVKDVFNASLKTDFGMAINASEDWKETHAVGGGTSTGESTTEEIYSMIGYKTTLSSSSIVTETISANMPRGYYAYVYATDVRVFAIVTYDAEAERFYLNTYNVLDGMHTMIMYYPDEADFKAAQPNSLSFDIPTERIEDIIKNSYFVKYDGDGGVYGKDDGSDEYIHLFEVGAEKALADNNYTKPGYVFSGWEYATENGTNIFQAAEVVKDLAAQGELITLKAKWPPMEYTVTFNANGGSVSTAEKTVTYDSTYGTLPTPDRTGYTFKGWVLNGNTITAESKVTMTESHTLEARWTANTYTITLNLNSSTIKTTPYCSGTTKTVTFDAVYSLPVPTASYYTFQGWYTKASGGTQITNANGTCISSWGIPNSTTLYAQWTQTYPNYTYITNATELKAIANNTSANYMLINNISNVGTWTPIASFSGTLNGNNYTITGISITISSSSAKNSDEFYGLFKVNNGTIKNLKITGSSIYMNSQHNGAGTIYAGFICGDGSGAINNVTIDNSSVEVHRSRSSYGLISGTFRGTVSSCTVSNSTLRGNGDTGGVSGSCSGTVESCVAKSLNIGYYVIHNNKSIGGIVGYFSTGGTIKNCSVTNSTFDFRGSSDEELDGDSLHAFNIFGGHYYCAFAPKVGYVVGHLQNCTSSGLNASGNTKAFTGGGSYDSDDINKLKSDVTESQYYFANSDGKIGKLN
ncbi:MAG: hypothetical protein E7597_05230 [Ruminococcaceae bacterium]|nr:hypothetical protein [Oscillospiraceae bacterium]